MRTAKCKYKFFDQLRQNFVDFRRNVSGFRGLPGYRVNMSGFEVGMTSSDANSFFSSCPTLRALASRYSSRYFLRPRSAISPDVSLVARLRAFSALLSTISRPERATGLTPHLLHACVDSNFPTCSVDVPALFGFQGGLIYAVQECNFDGARPLRRDHIFGCGRRIV
jgi:hypothetical protein